MSDLSNDSRNKNKTGLRKPARPEHILHLFVSGALENSLHAILNIKQICDQHLKGNYELEIIDIYQQPDLAVFEQIIVIPVLIIKHPLPEKRILGDLSNTAKVLEILNVK